MQVSASTFTVAGTEVGQAASNDAAVIGLRVLSLAAGDLAPRLPARTFDVFNASAAADQDGAAFAAHLRDGATGHMSLQHGSRRRTHSVRSSFEAHFSANW